MLADVGITANLQFVEWTTYSAQFRNAADPTLGYEFFLNGARPPGADPGFYDNWFECSGRTAYCNEAIAGLRPGQAHARRRRAGAPLSPGVGRHHGRRPGGVPVAVPGQLRHAADVTGNPLEFGRQMATVLSVEN